MPRSRPRAKSSARPPTSMPSASSCTKCLLDAHPLMAIHLSPSLCSIFSTCLLRQPITIPRYQWPWKKSSCAAWRKSRSAATVTAVCSPAPWNCRVKQRWMTLYPAYSCQDWHRRRPVLRPCLCIPALTVLSAPLTYHLTICHTHRTMARNPSLSHSSLPINQATTTSRRKLPSIPGVRSHAPVLFHTEGLIRVLPASSPPLSYWQHCYYWALAFTWRLNSISSTCPGLMAQMRLRPLLSSKSPSLIYEERPTRPHYQLPPKQVSP